MCAQERPSTPADLEVSGTVIDSLNKQPVELATVSISANGNILRSAATDHAGKFSFIIPGTGTYTIQVSFMGYRPNISEPLSGPKQIQIQLVRNAASLNQVIVTAKPPLVFNKGDKLIYNAGSDVSNKAGSATDVLRKVPLLTVSGDGEVRLRGSANIKVLLNGMPSGIIAKNLKEALKMIPASSIRSIEVITSPSAKYEAEGAAGIVNIITKRPVKGTNGNVDLATGNLEQSANATLNITREKFDYSFTLNTSRNNLRTVSALERTSFDQAQPAGVLYQQNDATQYDRGTYAGFSTVYRPDSSQKIGADLSYWGGSWPIKSSLYNRYVNAANPAEYNQRSNQAGNFDYYELSLHYQKKMKKKGQELDFKTLIARSGDRSDYTTTQFNLKGFNYFTEKGPNREKTWDNDMQVDYTHPLNAAGKNVLETGTRFTSTRASTSYDIYNNQADSGSERLVKIDARSDAMDYSQNIYAAYASLKFETADQWTFRAGMRFEGTALSSTFKNNRPSFSANFSNWVPSVLIAKKLNEHHELKLSYIERIRRPFIWDLNPYVNASDPRNLSSGNPQLRPEKTRTLEIGHTFMATSGLMLNSSIYYQANNDVIESFATIDGHGISLTTPRNIASGKRFGGNINSSIALTDKWTANGGLELYRGWFESPALITGNKGNFYAANINTSYNLPKNLTLQISGDCSNGFITLQGRNSAYWNYRLSVQKELFGKKANILVTFTNPFQETQTQRSYASAPTFRENISKNVYNRAFAVAFSWKFGSFKKQVNEEDRNTEEEARPARRGRF